MHNFFSIESGIIFGEFKCANEEKYINNDRVCDSISDCQYNSDEMYCDVRTHYSSENGLCNQRLQTLNCQSLNEYERIDVLKIPENVKKLSIQGKIFVRDNILSYRLSVLTIERNQLQNISLFFPNLISISITHSTFQNFNFIKSKNMSLLQFLNISYNKFTYLNFFNRVNCSNILLLDISFSGVKRLTNRLFVNFKKLKKLFITNSDIKFIDRSVFNEFSNVEELYLNKTVFPLDKSARYLKNLKNLKKIITDQFQICCLLEKTDIEYDVCIPQPTMFGTCDNIIPNELIRYLLWFYWIVGLFGNVVTIIIILKKRKKNLQLLRLCLSLSDLTAIFYLFFICIADRILKGNEYLIFDEIWRFGIYCKLLGMVISFSIILSMLSIMGISFEKYFAIIYPFKKNLIKFYTKEFIGFSVIFSIVIAVFPMIFYEVIFA